jgi:hypothetical protein
MNPHAEVACLHNRAVSELCLGEWHKVRGSHAEAERIGSSFARWGPNVFRTYNEGIIQLYERDFEGALRSFSATYEESLSAGFASLARESKAGIAIVHQRTGNLDMLHAVASEVRRLTRPNERMMSWINYAAIAYDDALNDGRVDEAIAAVQARVRELARRDASHRLALQLEYVILLEGTDRKEAKREKAALSGISEQLDAKWVMKVLDDQIASRRS